MPDLFPKVTPNKLAHLRYIYEHGAFNYYTYTKTCFDGVAPNFNKATFDYLYSRGLITQVYDNYFGDLCDITAYGGLVLSYYDPDYADIDLRMLFKRINQTYEVWHSSENSPRLFFRDHQSHKGNDNLVCLNAGGDMS